MVSFTYIQNTEKTIESCICKIYNRSLISVKSKFFAEIHFPYFRVGGYFFRAAMHKDASIEKQVGMVGNGKGFMHVMVSYEHPDVAFGKSFNNLLDIFDRYRINSGKGLIEKDEFRVKR